MEASLHQQIGELIAGLRELKEDNRELKDMLTSSERSSSEHRRLLHDKIEAVADKVVAIDNRVVVTEKDVTFMKPITEDIQRWKLIGIGALGMVGIAGTALGVTFADVLRRTILVLFGKG